MTSTVYLIWKLLIIIVSSPPVLVIARLIIIVSFAVSVAVDVAAKVMWAALLLARREHAVLEAGILAHPGQRHK